MHYGAAYDNGGLLMTMVTRREDHKWRAYTNQILNGVLGQVVERREGSKIPSHSHLVSFSKSLELHNLFVEKHHKLSVQGHGLKYLTVD